MIVIPTLMSQNVREIDAQVLRVKQESSLDRIQVDVIDGEFAPELTVTPVDLLPVRFDELKVDIHLMTNDPINDVIECSQITSVDRIIAQVEHMDDQKAFLEHVVTSGKKPGFSLDLYTDLDAIDEASFMYLSVIQLMGVQAGEQGQTLRSDILIPKIKELKTYLDANQLTCRIVVDGGVNDNTIAALKEAGVMEVAVGSFLWNSPVLSDAVAKLV